MLVFVAGAARSIWRLSALVLLAPILIATVVMLTADGDAYKARMIEEVARHMGVDVRINGPVDVDWGWPPSITLSDVQLAHTNSVGVDIITIDRMRTDFDLFSLATGELQPSYLRLEGVDIVMRPDALLEAAAGLEAATAPAAGPVAAAAAPAMGLSSMGAAVGAAGVSVAGASVTLVDPSTGQATTVDLIGQDSQTQIGDGSGGDGTGGDGSGGDGTGSDGSGGDGSSGDGSGGDGSGGDGSGSGQNACMRQCTAQCG